MDFKRYLQSDWAKKSATVRIVLYDFNIIC